MAGEDPWIYSFMPNLIWLPSWLAPLTDGHESHAQALLQRASVERFASTALDGGAESYVNRNWSLLPHPPAGPDFNTIGMAEFRPDLAFFRRRIAYLTMVINGCDSMLAGNPVHRRIVCTRYSLGLPLLNREAVASFAEAMRAYRDAIEGVVTGH